MTTREIFTTVSATGHATTKFKCVTFNATVNAKAKDTGAAREKAAKVLNLVMDTIKRLDREGAKIDMAGLKCTYDSPQPWMEYNDARTEQVTKGYQVNGSIVCSTEKVDMATLIMDALSKIDAGATIQRPSFTPDDNADVRTHAFMAAYNRAFEDFNLQCAVLGVDPDDYEVICYSPTQESHGGGHRGMAVVAAMSAESPSAAPPQIKAGRAEITAYVQLTFAKKVASKKKPATRAESGIAKTGNGSKPLARATSVG
jgi:uncharacterized protein YggE